MTQRKHYLDNLRTFAVLMLFPQHSFMPFNDWGETWYLHSAEVASLSAIKNFNSLWMMPLLFTIAGVSSRLALEKRGAGAYAKERVSKLLLPLIFGVLLIVPVQSYIAGLFWNGHAGYFDSFTKLTDLRGYDGAFTVGQLWFLLYLFVIAMVSLPFLLIYKKKGKGTFGERIPLIALIPAGILPLFGRMVFDISGIAPLEYMAYFLLGYFFLANEKTPEKLDKRRFWLLGFFLALAGIFMTFILTPYERLSWFDTPFFLYIFTILLQLASWLSILALIGLGRHYLNFSGRITGYLAKSSFGVYLFHQSWLVTIGYFVIKNTGKPAIQYPLILLGTIVMAFLTYEGARRVAPLRWMFALKK